jgi:DNA-binding NtrC family response regulator
MTRRATANSGPAPPANILLVDDEPELASVLSEFLVQQGYAVVSAHSVAAARQALAGQSFALVLLDLRLPDGSGVDLMHEARAAVASPEVVFVTGHATIDSAIAAVQAGAAGYVLKPVDLESLGTLVDRVLERQRLMAENARLRRNSPASCEKRKCCSPSRAPWVKRWMSMRLCAEFAVNWRDSPEPTRPPPISTIRSRICFSPAQPIVSCPS